MEVDWGAGGGVVVAACNAYKQSDDLNKYEINSNNWSVNFKLNRPPNQNNAPNKSRIKSQFKWP